MEPRPLRFRLSLNGDLFWAFQACGAITVIFFAAALIASFCSYLRKINTPENVTGFYFTQLLSNFQRTKPAALARNSPSGPNCSCHEQVGLLPRDVSAHSSEYWITNRPPLYRLSCAAIVTNPLLFHSFKLAHVGGFFSSHLTPISTSFCRSNHWCCWHQIHVYR